jgi:hypothetical protein
MLIILLLGVERSNGEFLNRTEVIVFAWIENFCKGILYQKLDYGSFIYCSDKLLTFIKFFLF